MRGLRARLRASAGRPIFRPYGEALLRPCPAGELEAVPVSTRVNSPRHDDAALLEPEGEPIAAQGTLV